MNLAHAFPARLEDVDLAWLTKVMRDADVLAQAGSIVGFDVVPIGPGFGQTGESVRLRLYYDGPAAGAPETIFAKFSTQDEVRRAASVRLGLYRREVDFYRRLAPLASVRVPQCYFAAVSEDGGVATLLL